MKLRFTGEWPPRPLWHDYPNWEYALEEEGEPGQDETTLKPSPDQTLIGPDVVFTAGFVRQADGTDHTAIIELSDGAATGVTALITANDGWSVQLLGEPARWTCVIQDWLPESERSPSVTIADASVFPLIVSSILPSVINGRPLAFTISTDGTVTC